MKTIVLDTQGADRPQEILLGAADALESYEDLHLILTGDPEAIEKVLSEAKLGENGRARLTVIAASEEITNDDSPARAILRKKDSGLVKALCALKGEDADGMISAGNTGAVLAGASILVGCREGVERPTLATLLPNAKGGLSLLLDCGANVDCLPERLMQFAALGSEAYARMFSKASPAVALLSVGVEEHKGNKLTKEAYALLKESNLNFVGNMEAREVLSGDYDVMVCDGFAGNMILKNIEGTAMFVLKLTAAKAAKLYTEEDEKTKTGKLMHALLSEVDINSRGGALLLGVNKPIVKIHGAANRKTVVSAVGQLYSL